MTALRHTGGGLERFRGLDDRTGKVVPGLKEFAAYRAAWQGSGCQHGAPTQPVADRKSLRPAVSVSALQAHSPASLLRLKVRIAGDSAGKEGVDSHFVLNRDDLFHGQSKSRSDDGIYRVHFFFDGLFKNGRIEALDDGLEFFRHCLIDRNERAEDGAPFYKVTVPQKQARTSK